MRQTQPSLINLMTLNNSLCRPQDGECHSLPPACEAIYLSALALIRTRNKVVVDYIQQILAWPGPAQPA